ncbi:glycosyltransferase family 4 protein [Spirulina sp. CS-785/01]|uniref:glycosyltransferase family 4 protein n=1 Tax=Spirulina sp. CS-785/01 TaxID=3021716 RepID=UPI00232C8226|nr:glycosyltransferase family 4 protein [Spirulina sp. CS-785/01]MDB9311792.1 glycosyltransferase family 4 protein [Spirulina sp. CS-785/01]
MLHVPLNRNFGGSRVQLELAEEWEKLGHHIEKFDANDAFPQAKHSLFNTLTRPRFHEKAEQFIRDQGHRFDIIDAHQGNITCSKTRLGFSGLLVTRSVGLYPLYEAFRRSTVGKGKAESWKTRLVNGVLAWRDRKEIPHCFQSYHHCDLINLPNPDEKDYLETEAGLGDKCVVFPFGLSEERLTTLQTTSKPPAVRLQSPQVVFIGTWCLRKGSKDWPQIIQQVREKVPHVQFLFLGTGSPANVVLEDLNLSPEGIKIIPSYDSNSLPSLLENATVGAFPSYIEGFGFAVLEKLAAGIPTVAYDVPGPREMLQRSRVPLMVRVGDSHAFSQKLIDLLQLQESQYHALVQDCQTIAEKFRWSRIAKEMLTVYQERLTQLS